MKEDFLHYVWQFQKITTHNLQTTDGATLIVEKVGQHNLNSGPDFFNGQVRIDTQLWAGTIEIHIKSSDWYAHNHETDAAYDTVILHVVWEHNTEIYRKDGSRIPTLVLKDRVASEILHNYNTLFSKKQQFINCENELPEIGSFTLDNWKERLYIERLEQKVLLIQQLLGKSSNDWEALLFQLLCKNFGLKVNSESFLSIANTIDFSILRKCAHNAIAIESLLLGQAGMLDGKTEDSYYLELQKEYAHLKAKYALSHVTIISPKYFRLRPPNFPTIRLSQLGQLYHQRQQLFQSVIECNSLNGFYELFLVNASGYWDTHYNFGVSSVNRPKKMTKSFIDLLLINTVIPVKYAYARFLGTSVSEEVFALSRSISKEKNSIINKYNTIVEIAENAMDSQALLQLKTNYCDTNKCLRCAIGTIVLRQVKS